MMSWLAEKAAWLLGILAAVGGFFLYAKRQGKKDEARKLAIEAAAKMKPLPADEQNPLAGGTYWEWHDDLILWLAYKEAKALLKFDAAAPPKAKNDKK